MKENLLKSILDNLKTIFYALIIAVIIRSFFFQPFYIPSSSMEPTLLIGDRIFVSKYSYGFSRHSFPFSPNFSKKRFFFSDPKYGDLVVFKTPVDNRTDYIKRLIGLPGDEIKFIENQIFINGNLITKENIKKNNIIRCGPYKREHSFYEEILPNKFKFTAVYANDGSSNINKIYSVPADHYFLMGDNRDCSNDSRFDVGYVNKVNLVGKAQMIFFSNDTLIGSVLKIWNWNKSFRFQRFFKKL